MGEQMSVNVSSHFTICALAATRGQLFVARKCVSRKSVLLFALFISHPHSLSVKIIIDLQLLLEHSVTLVTDIGPKQPYLFCCHFLVIPETEVQYFD